jgi:DNA-binding MarR family transcriptional regulator
MSRLKEISYEDTFGKALMVFTQTTHLVEKYIDASFYKNAPITFTKFLFLKILANNDGAMNASQVAEWTHIEIHTMTKLVARLKKDSLVFTERSDLDKRKINISITDKGRSVVEQSMPVAKEIIDKIMKSVTKEDAVKFIQILDVLRENAHTGLDAIT